MKKQTILFHLISFLGLTLLFHPVVSLFFTETLYVLLGSVLCAFSLTPIIFDGIRTQQIKISRGRFQQFLQSMVSLLNLGSTLRHSLEICMRQVRNQKQAGIYQASVEQILRALSLQVHLQEVIPLFNRAFPCPEAKPFFALLTHPERLGNNLPTIFEQYEQNLRDSTRMRESLRADQAKSLVESISLTIMPILLLVSLKHFAGDFLILAYQNSTGQAMLAGAFLLFLLSCFALRKIYFPSKDSNLEYRLKKNPKLTPKKLNRTTLLYSRLTPNFLKNKNVQAIRVLKVNFLDIPDEIWKRKLILTRLRFLMYGLFWFLISFLWQMPIWLRLIFLLLLPLYPDYNLANIANSWRIKIQNNIEEVLFYLVLCLRSGYSLETAFAQAESVFRQNMALAKELETINSQLRNQHSFQNVLQTFSNRMDLPETSLFIRLLIQFGAGGGAKDLQLMELQLQQLRHSLREKTRKRESIRQNRYMIPMTLDLISVILISLAPVLPGFQF